jgi:molybdenum cofactor cytidylyltransferase
MIVTEVYAELAEEIAGIVLAAGYSSRMGSFKPLLPLGSSTAMEMALMSLRSGGVEDVVVVTGHRAEELRPRLTSLGAREAQNQRPELGMFSSVLVGVAALPNSATAIFILPSDIPMVKPSTIRQLSQAYLTSRATVVYPTFRGERGHPPLIARSCFAEPLPPTLRGGLATMLARQANAIDRPVLDEGVLWDMDTPEEYTRMVAQAEREGVPTEAECEAILAHFAVSSAVIAHSRAVAVRAVRLAEWLEGSAGPLDIALAYAAGMLHDVAKGRPAHDREGERMLREIGYDKLGAIVGQHVDIDLGPESRLGEAHLLYLADKLVQGEKTVSLAERFHAAIRRYSGSPEILTATEERFRTAEAIAERIKRLTGLSLGEISDPERNDHAAD